MRWQDKIVGQRDLFVEVEISVMQRRNAAHNCGAEMWRRLCEITKTKLRCRNLRNLIVNLKKKTQVYSLSVSVFI